MEKLTPAQLERTLHTSCDVSDLNVRHPLERKAGILCTARSQANDRHAAVVHEILAPEWIRAGTEYSCVEAHDTFVLGNGIVGAQDFSDTWGQWVKVTEPRSPPPLWPRPGRAKYDVAAENAVQYPREK
jgi:hypothetical protein